MIQFQEATLSFSTDDFAKALEQHDYQFQKGQVVRGKVASYDSDGAYIDIGGKAAAFLPLEEASLKRVTNLEEFLPADEEREFMIIREQDADGQVTLSLRQLEIRKTWERLAELQESNQTIQARVSGLNKGGVTADVQGIRGFIPRSHLVERNDLESLIGKALTVSLIEVDPNRRRLVLSHRMASQAASLSQLAIGQLIEGKVVSLKPFGVFVDFEGTTGLLHINQVSKNYVASLNAVFDLGQPIKALIIDLDEAKRRVSLSTKVLESYPGEMLEKMSDVMAEADVRAEKARKNIEQRGVE
ncbi:MAG: S1 RNA-binding domain-containing protein [Oscillatoriophycideae cyanobacterium NC_groundwater_1537_Pr4_S-0.65um_50_18]|nr:S1 RNA-binding domain-containing protein [Oscillatoriophycideae cyanobacterium NC_groundwater_1537_Pr4_S-0.65um_50_18]